MLTASRLPDVLGDYFRNRPRFSGNVLVAQNGHIAFHASYGFADADQQTPNTLLTRFKAASLTKPLTATAILQLLERGLLTLDQPIDCWFPAWQGYGITIAHLLTHTSGIPNYVYHLRKELRWHLDHTPQEILAAVGSKSLLFEPGRKLSYNNTGYLLLGLIVERMTGQSLHDYVREQIFQPAGMLASGFESDRLEGIALGRIKGRPGPALSPHLLFACGDLVTTTEDVYRFDLALHNGTLLQPATVQLMSETTHHNRFVQMGRGLMLKQLFNRPSVCHGGTHMGGFVSHYERYLGPENLTIIVLANDMHKHSPLMMKEFGGCFISREVASLLFEQKLPFWQKVL